MFLSYIFLVSVSIYLVSTEECSCDFNTDVCDFEPINQTDSWKWSADEQPPFNLSNDTEYVWINGVAGLSDVLLISPLLTDVTPETEFSFDCYISSTDVSLYGQFIREGDSTGNAIWIMGADVVPGTWTSIGNVNCDPTGHGLCCGSNVTDYPCDGRFAIQFSFMGLDNSSYAGFDNFNSTASCDPITTSSTSQGSTGTGETTTYTGNSHSETMTTGSTMIDNGTVTGSTKTTSKVTIHVLTTSTSPVTASTATTRMASTVAPTTGKTSTLAPTTGMASTVAPTLASKFSQFEKAIIILMSVATFLALTTVIIVLARTLNCCRISSRKSSLDITSFS